MPIKRIPVDNSARTAILLTCLLLMATAACFACAFKGKLYRIRPGRVHWEGIHNVAVRGFHGHYGEILCSHVYKRLAQVRYFNPTDANQICAVSELSCDTLEEVEFVQSVEDLEADAVITGHVAVDIRDIHGFDQIQVKEGTGFYKKAKNAHGEWVDVEIKRTVVRAVPHIIRKASLATEYKVFDLKAKGVIALGEFTEALEEKFGGDKEYTDFGHKLSDLPTSGCTADELSARAAAQIVAKLSRMRLARFVKLDKGGDNLVKRGVTLAKKGKWEEAVQIWEQVIYHKPDNAAAYYNLGVAHEGLGDLESLKTARDLYTRAADYGENELYADGIKRVDDVISPVD